MMNLSILINKVYGLSVLESKKNKSYKNVKL